MTTESLESNVADTASNPATATTPAAAQPSPSVDRPLEVAGEGTKPAKPVRLSTEQLAELDWARRSDGTNDDWVELYRAEFPPEEQRDVEQLRTYVKAGEVVLHETRDKSGKLLTWSMSQDYPAAEGSQEPSFWLGCWTVTRREFQSSGIGRLHFARVVDALKSEFPAYIGRLTEIESTDGLESTSQPVRRAKFYRSLGIMHEVDVSYEIPLYQPVDAAEYVPQAKLGKGIKGQLLVAPFGEALLTGAQARSILQRVYETGYNVSCTDPYIGERLALVDAESPNVLIPIRILAKDESKTES